LRPATRDTCSPWSVPSVRSRRAKRSRSTGAPSAGASRRDGRSPGTPTTPPPARPPGRRCAGRAVMTQGPERVPGAKVPLGSARSSRRPHRLRGRLHRGASGPTRSAKEVSNRRERPPYWCRRGDQDQQPQRHPHPRPPHLTRSGPQSRIRTVTYRSPISTWGMRPKVPECRDPGGYLRTTSPKVDRDPMRLSLRGGAGRGGNGCVSPTRGADR